MERFNSKKKVLAYFAIIFFLTLIILFFVLEFRFIKRIMQENEQSIEHIVSTNTSLYIQDLKFFTGNVAKTINAGNDATVKQRLENIGRQDSRITNVMLTDERGYVLHALGGRGGKLEELGNIRGNDPYVFGVKGDNTVSRLGVAAPVGDDKGGTGYLVVIFNISDFSNNFILSYSTEKLKVALMDRRGYQVVWPFSRDSLARFNPGRETFKTGNVQYFVERLGINDSTLDLYFFIKQNNLDTYRIITIMFLLFTLYFLIYQFFVELLKANNINSYFENVDFNIFNNLKEGIIIANKFNKIVFANNVAHEIFAEKNIIFKKTELKEIIGNTSVSDKKVTLKKSDNLLEIISSPIFKNGKLLGSLVVISLSREKELLCSYALDKVIRFLQDGVIFVDKDNKVMVFNLMASYYLGNIRSEMDISDINSELASLLENSIGSTSLTRGRLFFGDILCEIAPIYDNDGFYSGAIIFLKNKPG
jgi:hypothetical protein